MATGIDVKPSGGGVRRLLRHVRARLDRATGPMRFVLRNAWHGRRLRRIERTTYRELQIGGMQRKHLPQVDGLYHAFAEGRHLSGHMRTVLWLLGPRLCLTAVDPASNRVVAVSIYCFNIRDVEEASIHAAYSAVAEEQQRRGIGTAMRCHALAHFARCGLRGVSTRLTVTNTGSWKIAERLGFEVHERYYDDAMAADRAYMVCDLSRQARPSP